MSSTSDVIDFTDHHGRDQDNGDGKVEKDGSNYSTGHDSSKDPDIFIFIHHILALLSQTNMRYLINTLQ